MDTEGQLKRFREVVEHSQSMFVFMDPLGHIEFINKRVTEILGFTEQDLLGTNHDFTPDDESGAQYRKTIADALNSTGIFSGEVRVEKKDGTKIWVRGNMKILFRDGKPDCMVAVMEDIQDEVELKRLLRESNEMMKTIMDNANVGITVVDYNGTLKFFNRQAELDLGFSAELLKSKSITELLPADGPSALESIRQIFSTKQPVHLEKSYIVKGKEKVFDTTRLPIFDPQGEVNQVLSIFRNITENKHAEKMSKVLHAIDSLQSISETFWESLKILFDNLFLLDWVDGGGLYLINRDKEILELIYHRGLSEDFISHISSYSLESDNAKVVLQKKTRYVTFNTYLSSSREDIIKEKITFIAALPLFYQDKVLGLLNLASRSVTEINQYDREITETIALKVGNLIELILTRQELDRSNAELQSRLEELREKHQMLIQKSRLESLGELSAGLAHEINQPLSIISLAMENINYKLAQEAATREYLEKKFSTITQNINKIRELIDHVRIFSRDQGTILFEQVDVNLAVRKALSMIGSQLKHRNISVMTELADDIGYTLGNPSRLEQVMLNLLSNSRDAVEEKAAKEGYNEYKMEIRIKTSEEGGKILIRVRDNGIGIPGENLSRIINPFFTTKAAGSGTGLGLPIVYGIIREMKGDIEAVSEEEKYTEIRISLPQYK